MVGSMDTKKRILLLTTGGTIASVSGVHGLVPRRASQMAEQVRQLQEHYDIQVQDLMSLDSSNILPQQWQEIARVVYENRNDFDGIVISHGTDTMAYTASAVTFMLPGIPLPVVFTGSQLPLTDVLSDGPDNLRTAFAMASSGCAGVFLAFDRKVMRGCRAVKVRASGFSAFESVNARYVATVSSRGLVLDKEILTPPTVPPALRTQISNRVFLLKLTPGLSPEILDTLCAMGYQGIVLEAFGLGGINVLGTWLDSIRKAIGQGVSVVVTTQCLYDSSDLRVYQVGNQLLEQGVLQGRDMTTEAAMTKLMWALGQSLTPEEMETLFCTSIAGEITL